MHSSEKNKREIYFVGISARTNNTDEMSGKGKIKKTWETFYSTKFSKKIRNKVSSSVFAVYYDYESDHNGLYSFLLGYQVKNLKEIPEGFTGITIPASRYVVVKTAKGQLSKVVIDAWIYIWNSWNKEALYKRRYTGDFEEYGITALNPENGRAKLYISVE